MKCLPFLAFLFFFANAFSQTSKHSLYDQLNNKTENIISYILLRPHHPPLETTNIVLNMLNVDSTNTFDSKTPGLYKIDKYPYFIVEYHIKDITPLIDFTGLMKIFNIDSSDQHLPVFIDSLLAYRPEKTYYELGDVQSVNVSREKSSGFRFINIITLFPRPKHLSAF